NRPSFIERAVGAPRAPLQRANGRPLASDYRVLFNSSGAARSEGGVALALGVVRGRGRWPSCSYRPACCFSGGALKTIVREPWRDETELCACAFGNVAVELCAGVVEEVETPPGSCPQGCVFASVALPHRNEIAIMRSAHFLWRSCHVQCDSTSEPTSGKQFARTLVRACLGAGRGSWKRASRFKAGGRGSGRDTASH